jgi:hypothetical protein
LTYSTWVKRSVLSTYQHFGLTAAVSGSSRDAMRFDQDSQDVIQVYFDEGGTYNVRTSAVFRDPSAWYNIVIAIDTTLSTTSQRVRIYVNNVEQTLTGTQPIQNYQFLGFLVSGKAQNIGRHPSAAFYFNGYLSDVYCIDGQQLTPSSFGETDPQTGVWIPKVYTGSYGTNGFRLRFNNNSSTTALGYDTSGNGNNWTPNNFSVTAGSGNDSMLDVPSLYGTDTGLGGEVRGNYTTFNPLVASQTGSTLSNGNLDVVTPTTGTGKTNYGEVTATIGVSSGKWYWEVLTVAIGGGKSHVIGVDSDANASGADGLISAGNRYSYASFNGNKYSGATSSAYGATYDVGDTVGVALDMDNGSITFYKNGVSQGVAFTGLSGAYYPAISDTGGGNVTLTANFGQRPFAYTAPSGFKALCTTNLSAPIGQTSTNQADNYFNTVLYTGTGSSLSVTGTGFQPDLVWIKSRSAATDHALYDAVRGVQKQLESNTTTAETTETTGLTAFGSDGFTVGALAQVNTSSATYVAWQWYAGGSTVTNTQGTITSSVRANPASGFSVVTFTGSATNNSVGHGLGITPSFVIVKSATEVASWVVYHSSLVSNGLLILNSTAAVDTTIPNYWGSGMTSSVIGVYAGGIGGNNRTGQTMIAYCFAAIPGFSAFGSYTGNGSTDGPFVYTGFLPAFVLVKRTNLTGYWTLVDNKRSTYNVVDKWLYPNATDTEVTVSSFDFLSNGFKLRYTGGDVNASGSTYIYAAFAEYPFRLALAR